jgi:DNA-binding CsgD family transcriptional regulator/PAS domain-containing protein
MNKNVTSYETGRLSDLIGAVYDCAIDPSRWDATLDGIRDLLDCANGILYVAGLPSQALRLEKMVGIDRRWAERLNKHGEDVAKLHTAVADFYTRPLDEPFVCSRDVPEDVWLANGYYREWAEPQGIVDVIDTVLMRRPDRVASCALGRHESAGLISEREVVLTRLIAPHLRRAATISDLVEMKSLKTDALGATLDALAVGVVLVAEDGAVVHANRAAERMFGGGGPICSLHGQIGAHNARTTERLLRTIAIAARRESEIGAAGIGMALDRGDAVATAHVLPLASGDVRTQLMPKAAAAVFVASEERGPVDRLEAVAEAYGLTRSETRLLDRIVRGESLDEAAAALKVAKTTSRTHMARILAKTGTRRQTALLALVHKLAPALHSTDR